MYRHVYTRFRHFFLDPPMLEYLHSLSLEEAQHNGKESSHIYLFRSYLRHRFAMLCIAALFRSASVWTGLLNCIRSPFSPSKSGRYLKKHQSAHICWTNWRTDAKQNLKLTKLYNKSMLSAWILEAQSPSVLLRFQNEICGSGSG